ncbi:WhiB family transcriptional regulator [Streptomyces sp. NPDC038707]|uniref:WhiB family transcriptional regulator n=1 Tax=Streptomyces sp. NPDC038707 TaxID=3154329 RepID=UPI0033FA5263
MSNYTGAVPDTVRQPDWRTHGACQYEDPELFFKTGTEEIAKTVCRGCPVREDCLTHALDERIEDGVWGGLTEDERRNIRRQAVQWKLTAVETQRRLRLAEQPPRPRTMQEVFEESILAVRGDHLEWTGPAKPKFGGRAYSPAQLSFIVSRGRAPEGAVLRRCGTPECVRPEHLTDGAERRAASLPTAA